MVRKRKLSILALGLRWEGAGHVEAFFIISKLENNTEVALFIGYSLLVARYSLLVTNLLVAKILYSLFFKIYSLQLTRF